MCANKLCYVANRSGSHCAWLSQLESYQKLRTQSRLGIPDTRLNSVHFQRSNAVQCSGVRVAGHCSRLRHQAMHCSLCAAGSCFMQAYLARCFTDSLPSCNELLVASLQLSHSFPSPLLELWVIVKLLLGLFVHGLHCNSQQGQ